MPLFANVGALLGQGHGVRRPCKEQETSGQMLNVGQSWDGQCNLRSCVGSCRAWVEQHMGPLQRMQASVPQELVQPMANWQSSTCQQPLGESGHGAHYHICLFAHAGIVRLSVCVCVYKDAHEMSTMLLPNHQSFCGIHQERQRACACCGLPC